MTTISYGERLRNQPRAFTRGLVERFDGEIVLVLVGERCEEWYFPRAVLPERASEGSVLVLRAGDTGLEVVALDPAGEIMKRRPFDERLRRAERKERQIGGFGARQPVLALG